ncbi:hypothetical protein EW026_g5682 [Hermanssonia centrifuga]|uniref:Uncharacterized protein n=1 Tax=Hermanssonia centrifuga TaxID=98765 RepID=A0A4S4KDD2_9APHY|nr:hypothetical protein EW026_g5682 [Hermanssonia centrifuga]
MPNPDLSGIGVRVAFYLQSFMSGLLVVFSPRDSVPTAWAGTLLTTALVIAGMVGKFSNPPTLSLHHATLIMNFATLACISSLAAAPKLPTWRLSPAEYVRHQRERHIVSGRSSLPLTREDDILTAAFDQNAHKLHIRKAQKRSRLLLCIALLLQVVFQWAWGIILFVSPLYSQPECNNDTRLVLFLYPFDTGRINNLDISRGFLVWPAWLLFSLGSTVCLTIILSLTGPSRANDPSSHGTFTESAGTNTPVVYAMGRIARAHIISFWASKRDRKMFLFNILVAIFWMMLIVSSEWQRSVNNPTPGENDFSGFGQITALLLSLAPAWSLTVAFYKYPSFKRKQESRRRMKSRREWHRLLPASGTMEPGNRVRGSSNLNLNANSSLEAAYEMQPLRLGIVNRHEGTSDVLRQLMTH